MEQMEDRGVTFLIWPKSELDKFKEAWEEVADEMSRNDPLFSEVYSSYKSFRERFSIWGSRAYLR